MPDYKRKLTAIFSADVAGYSRLMEDDESGTVKTLTAYREVMYSLIKQHRGRVVDSPGDNLLAEFGSVVDAAQCGLAVQKEIQSRNSGLPEDRKMQFRIGINLGDVIEEGERIYGDGVNIAARLEALADPGGICISKTAFDHIESKLPLGYEFIGEQTVKNISRPVIAYKVIMDPRITSGDIIKKVKNRSLWKRNIAVTGGIAVLLLIITSVIFTIPRCSGPQTGKKQDQRPSIVILPFKNISGDPNQEPFSDGITEELIYSLARIKGLKVISSTSSFYYKGKDMPLSTIGEELSVDYVLEGSVRKDDKNILIYSQLISVADDTHLLTERYNRALKDIFNVQEEITKAVASELKIELLDTEYEGEGKYSIVEHERRTGITVVIDDNEIITGGLLAAGANVHVAGSVKGGLKAYGGNIVISGTSQDVVDFWAAGNVTLSGNFKDKVKGAGGDIIISGIFEKDLEVHAKHITLSSTAVINGDFYYSGTLDRKDGSQIGGEITELDKVSIAPWSFSNEPQEKSKLLSLLGKFYWDINIIILGILIYFFFPKQKEKILSAISSESYLKTIGKGLLFLIASPFIIFISMLTFVGIPFGTICSCMLTVIIFASPVFGCLWIGRKLLNYIKFSFADNFFISLVAGIIVLEVLAMIPFVGLLAKAIPFLMSVGAIWHVIWMALKSEREVVS